MRPLARTAAVLLLLAAPASHAADLASAVSEDVLLFAEVADPKGLWADFEKSGLREMIRGVPNGEVQFRLATGVVQQVAFQQLGINIGDFAGRFAKRFGIVLLDVPAAGNVPVCVLFDAGEPQAALRGFLRNTVERTLKANNPNTVIVDDRHQNVPFRRVVAMGQKVAYAFLGDVLAIGPEPAVRKLIEGRAQRPLSASKEFTAVRRKLPVEKGIVACLNVHRLLEDQRRQLDANPELARRLDDLGITTLHWVAWSAAFDGRGIRDRVYLHAGERKIGLMQLATSLSQGTSSAAQVLPPECPIAFALAFKDGPELWRAILTFLEEGGKVDHLARLDEGRQSVLLRMGINFDEDFVGALGGEIALAANPDAIQAYAAKGVGPGRDDLPFIIALRVAKAEAIKTTIHRVMASQPVVGGGVDRRTEKHREVEISVLTIPNNPIRPAYAFVGDYLLITKTAGILRQCIDAHATGKSLAASPRYKILPASMPATYNGLIFADLEPILVAALTQGRGLPAEGQLPVPLAIVSQLRATYGVVTAERGGLTLETYTRAGLLGVLAALSTLEAKAPAAKVTPAAPPRVEEF